MNRRRGFRFLVCIVLLPALFTVISCRTTNSLSVEEARGSALYDILDEEASPPPTENGKQYLFIRLYDPVYKNPLYMSTFLKAGIAMTEVHKPLKLSHSSIGFDLTDNFFGLTLMPRPMLNEEHCMDVDTNEFMKQCRMDKSSQTTYAIEVTDGEYEKAKRVIDEYRDAKYSVGKVIGAGLGAIGRKFFHTKKNETLEKALRTKKGAEGAAKKMDKKRKFTCSSFVSFVLYNSVDEIKQYFDMNNTNLSRVSVTDLAFLPGVEELFSSSWEGYEEAAREYAALYPQYMPYMERYAVYGEREEGGY